MKFRSKADKTAEKVRDFKQYRQDVWSAQEFINGLKDGKYMVGSLLFSGDNRELKIIRQLCRYLGYEFVGKSDRLCGRGYCTNTFYVTHYEVR